MAYDFLQGASEEHETTLKLSMHKTEEALCSLEKVARCQC